MQKEKERKRGANVEPDKVVVLPKKKPKKKK